MINLSFGFSPCPNDTFAFHALVHGFCSSEISFTPCLADIESLNKKSLNSELAITKVSIGVLPYILNKYYILNCGAALGRGCGPLFVSSEQLDFSALVLNGLSSILIPGKFTTAYLLFNLLGIHADNIIEMSFNKIIPALCSKVTDAGLIIHEGRFVYKQYGLKLILDLGSWWEGNTGLPLPLGVIVAKRNLEKKVIGKVEEGIRKSIEYAKKNPSISQEYIIKHAQELDFEIIKQHIETFVTDFSLNLEDEGRQAILKLLEKNMSLVAVKTEDIFFNNYL